jgi:hypothetical protein
MLPTSYLHGLAPSPCHITVYSPPLLSRFNLDILAYCSHLPPIYRLHYLLATFTPGELCQVFHHILCLVCAVYSMLSGEGQLYAYMFLISETTTPGINLRWYVNKLAGHTKCWLDDVIFESNLSCCSTPVSSRFLDVAGKKNSKAYIANGVAMFVTWLVSARTLHLSFSLH